MWKLQIEDAETYIKLHFELVRLDQAYNLIEMVQKTTTKKVVYTLEFIEVE